MRSPAFWVLATISLLMCGALPVHADPASGPSLYKAASAQDTIVVDGVLDEPEWVAAPVMTLTQQNPAPGAPTPYLTRVRVLRGSTFIYIGIECRDTDTSRLSIHTLQRDHSQSGDDNVMVTLDTTGQKKLAYAFQVNAGGAMADGLISPGYTDPTSNTGSPLDYSWNGYWDSAVRQTADGWTVEIAIRTQSLQFDPNLDTWGINVSRYVPRDQLTLVWTGITLNATPTNLEWEGSLSGVRGLTQGSGFEFDPYVVVQRDTATGRDSTKSGFDLKYNFTPQTAGLFTYHTDFAEAEANTLQADISRFSLFIPETRAFFLDGSNEFTFSHNLSSEFIPFYSRDIGLINGEAIPLDEGLKVLGQQGALTVGALDTRMSDSDVSAATNLFAGRAAYNLNDEWRVGTLVTRGDPQGQTSNTLTAFDSTWSTSSLGGDKNLNVAGWVARSSGTVTPGDRNGYGVDIEYPNDLWYADFNYNLFGDALTPDLGFLPRPGTKQYSANVTYQPRPAADGPLSWIRQIFANVNYYLVTGLDNRVQSEDWGLNPVQWVTQGGWSLGSGILPTHEVVSSPFPIIPGVVIPVGSYDFSTTYVGISSPRSKAFTFSVTGEGGGEYSGRSKKFISSFGYAGLDGHFSINLAPSILWVYTPQGDGIVRVDSLTLSYSFTPNLTLSTLTQYNNISRTVAANTRLQWIIKPGRYLYLVWNHGQELNPNILQGTQTVTGNQFVLKVVWGLY